MIGDKVKNAIGGLENITGHDLTKELEELDQLIKSHQENVELTNQLNYYIKACIHMKNDAELGKALKLMFKKYGDEKGWLRIGTWDYEDYETVLEWYDEEVEKRGTK